MSNPLLQPEHPRWERPPPLTGEDGKNRFAEEGAADPPAGQAPTAGSPPEPGAAENVFAPSAAGAGAYRPGNFVATLASRGGLIVTLAGLGLAGVGAGVLAIWTRNFLLGTMPLFAIVPSLLGCVLGWEDLRAMQAGAMDRQGQPLTRLGFALALVALASDLALGAGLVWYVFQLPSWE